MGLLDGKVVAVSGVGPGLGRHIAAGACEAGASVMLGARSIPYLGELTAELTGLWRTASFRKCDVTLDEDCRGFIDATEAEFGAVDSVVCNAFASSSLDVTIEDGDLEEWKRVFEVNLFGSLRMAKAAIPALKRSRGPSIVFIGSQIVRRVFAGRGPYASSKAALLTAAQVLAREVGPYGIRVNTVVPGRMWGPSLRRYIDRVATERGTSPDEQLQRMVGDVALPRLATDEECARAVVFLVSDLAAAMTGQTIDANAGETFH